MDAIDYINNNVNIEDLLHHYNFKNITSQDSIIRTCCKIHDGNNPTSFVANTENNLWYCHSSCGGGDIFTLVQLMENISFKESVHFIADKFGIDITNLRITEKKTNYKKELYKWIALMKGYKKKKFESFSLDAEMLDVKRYRNFTKNTIDYFRLKYVRKVNLKKRNGDDLVLYNRLAFPLIFDGITIGISFRKIKASDYPKWSHQPANLNIGRILYNYDNVKNNNIIVICEGINDVWAFHEINIPAVATLGARITKEQYKLLLKTGADLVFAFDGDEAGTMATKKAIKMFKNKANIFLIEFSNQEDAENISRKELRERYDRRKKI